MHKTFYSQVIKNLNNDKERLSLEVKKLIENNKHCEEQIEELKLFIKEYSDNLINRLSKYEKVLNLSVEQKEELMGIDLITELVSQTLNKIEQILREINNEELASG